MSSLVFVENGVRKCIRQSYYNTQCVLDADHEGYCVFPKREEGNVSEGTKNGVNPKDVFGLMKVPRSTVPAPVIAELGVAMLEGALKYGRHNYRHVDILASVYYDALNRHMDAWWEGEDIDPDSGLSHVTKAIASLVVLRDSMIRGKLADDRPVGTKGFLAALNKKVKALLAMYPNPKPVLPKDRPPDPYEEAVSSAAPGGTAS